MSLKPLSCSLLASLFLSIAGAATAQTAAPPQNVLTLSAQGSVTVQQDTLTITLAATREGANAAQVQARLKQVLDDALTRARASAHDDAAFEVRSGYFSMAPRTDHDNRITGWQGRAELILEGRDFARLSQVAGQIDTLTISSVYFSLSREQRQQSEQQAQAQAIEAFKQRAAVLAKDFGFAGYTLREVSVDSGQGGFPLPAMRSMIAAAAPSMTSAPVPVEPGKTEVRVTVQGSVQLK